MGRAVEELRFVTQSENRATALDIVSADAPIDRRELESRLDASHRTVIRVVNSLEERGYLRETDEGLRLTPFGAHVAERLDGALEATETALEFGPLLRNAPPALQAVSLESLSGAELLVASDADPFSILDRVLSLRAEATRIREVAPGVQKESIDQLAERVRRGDDVDAEAVISRHASDVAAERADYRDGHASTVESDAVDIYVHPEPISFFAGVMDDTAALGVSKDGQPYALAVSADPDLRAATEAIFESYRDASAPKTTV
jgi:predicted transcriptional regulator